ncbi:hemolysin family protein [Shouchella shacheensis]|uniref:hemolysin family protein n=1 Tax=Shouchella shacheensis TaxID=1649580 RepID=UPI00073FFB55|nr:CNNM domain-containing protein [Shouchella shacheensis]
MIFAIIACLLVSLFFSGSETALTATNKMRLQTKAANHDKKSEKLYHLVSKPDEFITAILIGNNISNILLPTLVTMVAIDYGISVALATGALTVTIIIFAEVLPKSVAATFPDRIAYIVYPVIRGVVTLFKPLTFLLNGFTGIVIKLLSRGDEERASISKEELRYMVDIAHTEGTFENEETHRIKGILDFRDLNVRDALKTPRVDIEGIPSGSSFEEARDIVIGNRFTRYPVFKDDMDNIIGVFHSKFLISWSLEPEKDLKSFSDMDPLIVFEFHSIEWVFRKMLQERKHLAVVLDEYGGTEGIISHEDIIEAMIGQEIEDETDFGSDVLIEKVTDTEMICHGKITLHRLNSIFKTDIPEDEDILAGFLLTQLGYFPAVGEIYEYENLTFVVLDVDEKKVKRVQITKNEREEA